MNWREYVDMPRRLVALGSRMVGIQDTLSELVASLARQATRPHLATLTILCERSHGHRFQHLAMRAHELENAEWAPTVLGAETWLHLGQRHVFQLMPYAATRNFRWMLSGGPEMVVTQFRVGNEDGGASSNMGAKFGDCNLVAPLGTQIVVTVERKRAES